METKIKDNANLLNIFPKEIWDRILELVNDVKEYHNITNASHYFRAILLPRAPLILFKEAFKSLVKLYAHALENGQYSKGIIFLRHVCRPWKDEVDQAMQHLEYYESFHSSPGGDVSISSPPRVFEMFENYEHYDKFEDHFDTSHLLEQANPFFGRGAVFRFTDEDFILCANKCLQLLQKYGRHLWYCSIDLRIDDYTYQDQVHFYSGLSEILKLLPNLRGLEIQDFYTDMTRMSPAIRQILLDRATKTQFPNLKQLYHIYLFGMPFPVVTSIVENNPQVQIANLGEPNTDLPALLKLYLEQLPNLTKIKLLLWYESHFQALCGISAVARVQNLQLEASKLSVSLDRIFRVLETHFPHLTNLDIDLKDDSHQIPTKGLDLKNLKVLHLKTTNFSFLDYLLPLKNTLDELSVTVTKNVDEVVAFGYIWHDKDADKHKLSKSFLEFWTAPEKLIIWNCFPKLKLVETKGNGTNIWNTCTRRQWKGVLDAQNICTRNGANELKKLLRHDSDDYLVEFIVHTA